MTDLSKAIHVKLSDERRKVTMLEVAGEHFLGKLGDVLDIEGICSGSPADDGFDFRVLNAEEITSTISSSLVMKSGIWLLFPLLLLLLFIVIIIHYKTAFISLRVKFNMKKMFVLSLEQLLQKELSITR
jgi:hypothetical protein